MKPSRGCLNGATSALQPEEIIWKELYFHVCTINKSAHTKKSGNLSYTPRICIDFGEKRNKQPISCTADQNYKRKSHSLSSEYSSAEPLPQDIKVLLCPL